MRRTYFAVILLPFLFGACVPKSTPPVDITLWGNDAAVYTRVDSVMQLMTLDEKVGQMNLLTSNWDVTGPTMRSNYADYIRSGKVGNIFNAHTSAYTRELQRIAVEETTRGIPLLFGYDVIHGHKTIFPISLGESCSWDTLAIGRAARVSAKEAAASGIHWTYAPMVDLVRDPRWGRVSESAGEDPFLGSCIAAVRVRGFQGSNLASKSSVLACVKHFAAYGAAQAGRDYHTVDISDRELRDMYLPPFKAAVEAGCGSIMTSFNELDGVPASASKYLFKTILVDEWGFKGFSVTDYTAINELVPHGVAADRKQAALLAVNAGIDMDMESMAYGDYLVELVKEGKVDEQQIDNAVRRILAMKVRLGLFDDPYRYCDPALEAKMIYAPENLAEARDMARRSFVLLKNEKQTLPLTINKRIAVIGFLANERRDLIGSWQAAGDASRCTTILDAIRQQAGEHATVTYAEGCVPTSLDKKGFSAAIASARGADAIVFVMGERWDMSGEAASRSNIDLPGVQSELLAQLSALPVPLTVVLMNGRPLTLSRELPLANAMIECWYPGTEGGNAIADVLFGHYNPSGKLTMTFPRNVGQIPIYYNMKPTGRPIDGEQKYTSRYLDVPNTPLFPFGFGLSYTTFSYSQPIVNSTTLTNSSPLTVSVTVTNTGAMDGEEVVQLYVQDLVGSVTRPVRELKGFRKVMIKAGESKEVKFTLTAADLAFTRGDNTWGTEVGNYKLYVGTNSEDTQTALFALD
ncbi:MAG: beta-glucosidase BglX [Bacteroides sp.]